MIFDEVFNDNAFHSDSPVFDDNAIHGDTPMMDSNIAKCEAPCIVSQVIADCHAMPIAVAISTCTSEESSASSKATVGQPAISITGKFRNIEHEYRVNSKVLGKGCHGSARACFKRATGQRYAAKTICKSDPAVKPGSIAREIVLLKEMKHQSIIQLVDVYEDAEYIHLVTDLCEGGELFDKIVEESSNQDNSSACFSEDEAAKVMCQVLTAVSYMHRQGVAHRDLKPENILLQSKDKDSPVKIIDFGLARKHDEDFEVPMTAIVGTPYYIAPEVLRKKYNKSCDLWSVGVIAYILICGYPPFNGGNNEETHRAILRGRYHFPSKEWKGVSNEARDFIRRLLQTDPRKRMTVGQALNHPWIVRHNNASVVMSDDVPDNIVVEGLRSSRKGSMLSGRVGSRNLRKAMFGI